MLIINKIFYAKCILIRLIVTRCHYLHIIAVINDNGYIKKVWCNKKGIFSFCLEPSKHNWLNYVDYDKCRVGIH